MKPRPLAYLDLLGFSEYVARDPRLGLRLIHNCHVEVQSYVNAADRRALGFFLPMSDSVLIGADTTDDLLYETSRFLCGCHSGFMSNYAFPHNPQNPLIYPMSVVSPTEQKVVEEEWPPTLFRGGIVLGDYGTVKQASIVSGDRSDSTNVLGGAVVSAVRLEQEVGKGPRVFCGGEIAADAGDMGGLVKQLRPGLFELQWPRLDFVRDGMINLGQYQTWLQSAANLYKHFAKEAFANHYTEFLRLIVRSGLAAAETSDQLGAVSRNIRAVGDKLHVEFLINDLVNAATVQQGEAADAASPRR